MLFDDVRVTVLTESDVTCEFGARSGLLLWFSHVIGRPRPVNTLMSHMTKNTTNRIHAMFVAAPASPVRPSIAAINANTRKDRAQFNIIQSSFFSAFKRSLDQRECQN